MQDAIIIDFENVEKLSFLQKLIHLSYEIFCNG